MKRTYFSPGRINLIGEHIDYNGGNVLPVAINLGITGEVTLRDDHKIGLYSADFKDAGVIEIDLNAPLQKLDCWADYASGVLYAFAKKGLEVKQGFDLTISSTIPTASGLSSSAALEVLFAKIFSDLNNLDVSRVDMALLGQVAEVEFVGVNCGIMDQFIIANGLKNKALHLNTATLDFKAVDFDLQDYKIMILNTKVSRGLVDSKYNERRSECEEALAIAQKSFEIADLCELSIEQLESIQDQITPIVYKRAMHAVSEQHRVEKSIKALSEGNLELFFNCINACHQSLRDDYEVSSLELNTFVDLALKHGAVSARMVGAGFGGCAIAFVQEDLVDEFSAIVCKEYEEITNIKGEIYEAISNNGVDLVNGK